MKQKLHYFLPLLLAAGMGCVKSNYVTPLSPPSGTFTGTFSYQHRSNDKSPIDSLKANVTLALQGSNSSYIVTGDTSTVHAGSFGTYSLNSSYIQFVDKTYPATGNPAKKHLNGVYLYAYDGTTLNLLTTFADTVVMQYQLTKF